MVYKAVIWTILHSCILSVFGSQNMAGKPTVEAVQQSTEQTLYVGWASADITPRRPVALVGQMSKRISQSVLDPLTATVLA
ncbi:MAG: hypothetical protein ACYS29_08050, partial [Planctomycetota bacterium]